MHHFPAFNDVDVSLVKVAQQDIWALGTPLQVEHRGTGRLRSVDLRG